MASIDSYKYDIRRYNAIKSNIQTIISYLNNYSGNSADLIKEIKNSYSVNNDEPNLYNFVNDIRIDVQKTSNYLKNTVIPSINSAIYELNRKIQAEQAAEMQ